MKQINKLVISIFLIFIALFCTEVIFKTKDKEILETFRNENSSKKQYVYPLGNIVGIKANTDGALVIGFEEKNIEYTSIVNKISRIQSGFNFINFTPFQHNFTIC